VSMLDGTQSVCCLFTDHKESSDGTKRNPVVGKRRLSYWEVGFGLESETDAGFLISRSPLSDTSGGRAGFTKSFLLKHRTDRPCCTVDACHPVPSSLYERG
jgi:hypothetical protein